jgi:predicted CoA-binding protein
MATQNLSLETIEDFLAHKRIAMVGISREPRSFSVMLFEELCRRGYDVIPVNPNTPNVLGRRCFARLQDIQPPVEAALLMTSPAVTDIVVSDCAEAGIRQVWMYRAAGKGAVSPSAIAFCRDHGIQVVPGQCPFMFLPAAGGAHRLHGFLRKITGRFPHRKSA